MEGNVPLVAHPEPHRSPALWRDWHWHLGGYTRLPGGRRAKTLTPLSMLPHAILFLCVTSKKTLSSLSAVFRMGQDILKKKGRPRGAGALILK
jgi:hypothetical protein